MENCRETKTKTIFVSTVSLVWIFLKSVSVKQAIHVEKSDQIYKSITTAVEIPFYRSLLYLLFSDLIFILLFLLMLKKTKMLPFHFLHLLA